MGQEAKAKAARKKNRLLMKTMPKYVRTDHLTKEQRVALQRERDQALAKLKRQYEAAIVGIQDTYFKNVQAASQTA